MVRNLISHLCSCSAIFNGRWKKLQEEQKHVLIPMAGLLCWGLNLVKKKNRSRLIWNILRSFAWCRFSLSLSLFTTNTHTHSLSHSRSLFLSFALSLSLSLSIRLASFFFNDNFMAAATTTISRIPWKSTRRWERGERREEERKRERRGEKFMSVFFLHQDFVALLLPLSLSLSLSLALAAL